jgi:excisionase family DNA binding protein
MTGQVNIDEEPKRIPMPKMYSPQNLADDIGVSMRTIYRWIEAGKVKAIKIGRQWRIPQEEYDRITKGGLQSLADENGGEMIAASHP